MKQQAIFMILIVFAISSCASQTEPTPSQPSTFVVHELPSPTFAPLPSATFTPSPTPLPSATFTPSPTPVPTATFTPHPTSTPTPTIAPSPTPDPGPELIEVGSSVQNITIEAIRFGYGPYVVLFIGGLHAGFAPSTVQLADEIAEYFTDNPNSIPENVTVFVIPNVNPDSPYSPGNLAGRLNANGVDLNRNWDCRWTEDARFRDQVVNGIGGSKPFSEPETQGLKEFIEKINPSAVVFWGAKYSGGFVSPGRCDRRSDVSFLLAEQYGRSAQYAVDDFEIDTGQILNGDGTNWLDAQGFPAIVVLLPDYDEMGLGAQFRRCSGRVRNWSIVG